MKKKMRTYSLLCAWCTFTGNVSKNSAAPGVGNGGAVWSPEPNVAADAELASVCFSGCRFICNTNEASNGGGVFRNIGAVLVKAERGTFIGNASVSYGNVYNFGSGTTGAHGGLVMTDCVVSGNVSVVSGEGDEYNRFGTITSVADSGTFSLMRCRFIENIDVGGAGAVFVATPFAKVENCEFRSNRSMRCGFSAATLAFEPTATNAIVRGCLFADNKCRCRRQVCTVQSGCVAIRRRNELRGGELHVRGQSGVAAVIDFGCKVCRCGECR